MATVTMTLEEYNALVNGSTADSPADSPAEPISKPKRRSRTARASDKKLSEAFRIANTRYRLKDGSLRKGRSQSDIAKLAQKLRKKM